jgi:hypothetical protein
MNYFRIRPDEALGSLRKTGQDEKPPQWNDRVSDFQCNTKEQETLTWFMDDAKPLN